MTAETRLISTQSHHSIHLSDGTDHTGVVAISLGFPRCALKPPETLEQQIPLVDVLVIERLYPIFVSLSRDITGGSMGAPPCFGSKGS